MTSLSRFDLNACILDGSVLNKFGVHASLRLEKSLDFKLGLLVDEDIRALPIRSCPSNVVLQRPDDQQIILNEIAADGQGLDEELTLRHRVVARVSSLDVHRLAIVGLPLDQPHIGHFAVRKVEHIPELGVGIGRCLQQGNLFATTQSAQLNATSHGSHLMSVCSETRAVGNMDCPSATRGSRSSIISNEALGFSCK